MNLQEVRKQAKELGIKSGKMDKVTLIKTIQITEGNFDCFSTPTDGFCDQNGCLWRGDCFESASQSSH